MRNQKSSGFTLVELLVVIAIIGILATLLLPAIYGSLRDSRQAQCLSNLRQWSLGLTQYSGEEDGSLTAEGKNGGSIDLTNASAWFNAIPSIIGDYGLDERKTNGLPMPRPKTSSIFMCPSLPSSKNTSSDEPVFAYWQNKFIEADGAKTLKMKHIPKPSEFAYLSEVDSNVSKDFVSNTSSPTLDYRHGKPRQSANGSSNTPYQYGRGTRVNIGFLDGHAESFDWRDIYTTDGNENLTVMWDPNNTIKTP